MNHDSRSFGDDLSSLKADMAVIRSNYATREGLQELRSDLMDEIHGLRAEFKREIGEVRADVNAKAHLLETRLISSVTALGMALRAELNGVRLDFEKIRVETEAMQKDFHKALHAQTWNIYGFAVVLVTAVHFVTRAGY